MYTDREKEQIGTYKIDYKLSYLLDEIKLYMKVAVEEVLAEHKERQQEKEPLLTISDVANKFQVSKATVHNWKNRGSIVGVKFGKNRYFTEAEVRKSMAKYGFSKKQ